MCITHIEQVENLPEEMIVYKVFRKTDTGRYVSPYFPDRYDDIYGWVTNYYYSNIQYESKSQGKYGFYGFTDCPSKHLLINIAITTCNRSMKYGYCVVCKVKLSNLYMIGTQSADNLLNYGKPEVEYGCVVAGNMEILEEVEVQ